MDCKAVVDIQAFLDDHNEFIVKELTIVDVQTKAMQHWIFKPPYSFRCLQNGSQRTNRWLSKYYHKLDWTLGDVSYSQLPIILEYLNRNYCIIFVKGEKKKKLLERHCPDSLVLELEKYGCGCLRNLSPKNHTSCLYHNEKNKKVCTLYRATGLVEWIHVSLK